MNDKLFGNIESEAKRGKHRGKKGGKKRR